MLSHVLLIDDDPVFRQTVREAAAGLNLKLVEAATGEAGVHTLTELLARDAQVALVLLDLTMPAMTGLETLAEIRAMAPSRSLPVVVLTNTLDDLRIAESYDAFANAYVIKPMASRASVDAMRQMMDFWCRLNVRLGSSDPTPNYQTPRPPPLKRWDSTRH